jgi:flagellum-specific peptidoglycan hydrolase FlgJ
MTATLFTPEIIAAAQASERAFRPIGPYVSVTLAQWAIESAYGRALSGVNNCFGIKATEAEIASGNATLKWTHETLNGVYRPLPQYFANFASIDACVMAHAKLLATSPYYVKAQHATSPDEYADALTGVYATGIPGHPYGETLIGIMRGDNLYQYDLV